MIKTEIGNLVSNDKRILYRLPAWLLLMIFPMWHFYLEQGLQNKNSVAVIFTITVTI
jgi:hypothetical protein